MPKRILEGEVVSNKTDKTITVLVERRFMHPLYKKFVKKSKRYAAHDESNAVKVGERVRIQECAPISKRKTWTVITGDATAEKKAAPKKEEKAEAPKAAAPKKAAKVEEAPKAEVKETASNDLSSMTVAQLKALAKDKGIKGYTSLKKAELIEALSK